LVETAGQARLLILAPASSYRLAPYLRAAEYFSLKPVIVSNGEHSLVSEVAHGLHIDFSAPTAAIDTVLHYAKHNNIAGIIATDDYSVPLAASIASHLKLVHNPAATANITRRKDLSRKTLKAAGCAVPEFKTIDLEHELKSQIAEFPLPAVLKPLALSASRGVIRVNNVDEFVSACNRIKTIISDQAEADERRYLLLEAYLPGSEVAVEGFIYDGQFHCLALFDKPDALEGPFFEETYYITPSRLAQSVQDDIRHCVAEACHALGIITGPVHAECRIVDGQAWILEVAARTIGGECVRLLQFSTGLSLEQLVVSHAINRPIMPDSFTEAAGVLMIPTPESGMLRRVEGVLAAQQLPLIDAVHINIRDGNELVTLPEGNSYLGFIFARGDSADAVEQALRKAHACLKIVVGPLFRLGQV
jgi:biotin carboxylase